MAGRPKKKELKSVFIQLKGDGGSTNVDPADQFKCGPERVRAEVWGGGSYYWWPMSEIAMFRAVFSGEVEAKEPVKAKQDQVDEGPPLSTMCERENFHHNCFYSACKCSCHKGKTLTGGVWK